MEVRAAFKKADKLLAILKLEEEAKPDVKDITWLKHLRKMPEDVQRSVRELRQAKRLYAQKDYDGARELFFRAMADFEPAVRREQARIANTRRFTDADPWAETTHDVIKKHYLAFMKTRTKPTSNSQAASKIIDRVNTYIREHQVAKKGVSVRTIRRVISEIKRPIVP